MEQPKILVSPAEPEFFWDLGELSSRCEEMGADFLWHSKMGLVGVQRKQFPADFMASKNDGRLNKEYRQLQACDVRVLALEGRGRWSNTGYLMIDYTQQRWHITQHRNYLASVQIHKGVTLATTENISDTFVWIESFQKWTNKDDHLSLEVRPAAPKNEYWAEIANRDYQKYFLQSLPYIGPKLADAIIDHFHGVPFRLNATFEDFLEIPGIGPGRAQKIWDVFHKLEASSE